MEFRDILQLINSLLALSAIPPSLILLSVIMKERTIVCSKEREINKIITYLFIGIALASLINAIISVNSFFGHGYNSHQLSPFRSLFTNLFFFSVSWLLYNFQKKIKKG